MAFSDYEYDPTAKSVDNLISDEITSIDVSIDRSVFPEHGPFYGDANDLVVSARVSDGEWVELKPEVDFVYSPLFLTASATTNKQVFTYIVITGNFTSVKLQYRALGKYQDSLLLAQLVNTVFDRSKVFEWSKIWAQSDYYNPRVRDPELHDKAFLEILNEALTKISVGLNNPLSSTLVTSSDITKMQLAIANTVSGDRLSDFYKESTTPSKVVNAGLETDILYLDTDFETLSFRIHLTADSTDTNSVTFTIVKQGSTLNVSARDEVYTDDILFDLSLSEETDQVSIRVLSKVDGVVKLKLLYGS